MRTTSSTSARSSSSRSGLRAVAILHIPDSPFGAVAMGYRRLAALGEARGLSLDIVTPEQFPRVGRPHPRWWVLLVPFAAAVWLWRRRRDYDVAIFHSYAGWIYNLWPGRLPTVTDFHGLEPLFHRAAAAEARVRGRRLSLRYRLVYEWLMPPVLRMTCRRSRVVTCLNLTERQYLIDHGWARAERVVVLRQAVPAEFFVDGRAYAPRATRVLVLSQWLETKGVAYLREAFATVARAHRDVELWCYGTRADADFVKSQFPPDIRDRVRVVPDIFPDDVPAVYRDADIFLHASLSEGSGNAIMQAMASALPIVTTPVGFVLDVLQSGRDSLLVPVADSGAMAAAVSRLVGDVELRRRLGEAARRAAAIFEPAGAAPRFLEELEFATGASERRA